MGGCRFRVVLFRQGAVSQRQGDSKRKRYAVGVYTGVGSCISGYPAATI